MCKFYTTWYFQFFSENFVTKISSCQKLQEEYCPQHNLSWLEGGMGVGVPHVLVLAGESCEGTLVLVLAGGGGTPVLAREKGWGGEEL